ncbi:MAG: hypothetical protein WA775_04030 [Psychroserpens sp.]|uniref:hypothetical protein n=1 Tax=Psychroserpens sp. TaxID=2020870 RepID=UPI003C7898CA
MNLPSIILRAWLLATIIFWLIIACFEPIRVDELFLASLSIIPIFIGVVIVVVGTICPFFWFTVSKEFSAKNTFRTFYPYYAISMFAICVFGTTISDYDICTIAFFFSAFITTSQSWIWLSNTRKP